MAFIFGGNTGTTYEQMLRQRSLADAYAQGIGTPRTFGEGLSALGKGLAAGLMNRSANKTEAKGKEGANSAYDRAFKGSALGQLFANQFAPVDAGGIPDVNVPQVPVGPHSSDPRQDVSGAFAGSAAASGQNFPMSLVQSESGGNWKALNSEGYGGRLQFGKDRLADAARAGVIPAGMTGAQFAQLPPEAQQAVEQWHFADIDRQAERMGLNSYIGQTVAGIPITQDGIRAMAHLGGIGGAAKFLQSGGQYNPADSNGTSLADYAAKHGGGQMSAGQPAMMQGGLDIDLQAAAEALGNPFLDEGKRSVLAMLLQNKINQQNAVWEQQQAMQDPYRQAQLEQIQLQNEALRNPPAPERFETITGDQAAAMGLDPNNAYNVGPNGKITQIGGGGVTVNMGGEGQRMGGIPSGYTAVEDSSNPSGFRLEAIPGGPAAAEAQQAAGERASAVAQADQILSSIDGILNDPALEGATGWMSWRQRIPGTESYRFGTRARQLEGQAFLQAFEALKGGGAITEIEGQKATQAIGRLDTAQSAEDYRAALNDLRSVVNNARIRASGGTVQEPLDQTGKAQGQRLRFNPETGDFE